MTNTKNNYFKRRGIIQYIPSYNANEKEKQIHINLYEHVHKRKMTSLFLRIRFTIKTKRL